MKQKKYGCLNTWVHPAHRCLVLRLSLTVLIILLSAGHSYSEINSYPAGKQDGKLETWAFHSKIDLPENDGALYVGMFFCSGKLYFLKGNFAHVFWLDTSTGEYAYENNIYLPPFEKVTHSETNLDEKYHDSFFRYNAGKKTFLASVSLDKFCSKFEFLSEKKPFGYEQACQCAPEAKPFDWYMFPRMDIEASINSKKELLSSGQGHFQHFWGEEIDESGDFVVAHLESGYDVVINEMPPADEDMPMVQEAYILISDPEGNVQKISSFEYSVLEWADSGGKGKKYPANIEIKSSERNLNLNVRVFKKDQTANLLGVEKWFGYAGVEGRMDEKPQKGWAFFSPAGKKEH